MKKFIVLHTTEDGENFISFRTEKEIKRDFLGEDPIKVFEEPPDLGYCGAGILIIDGTIVVPKAVEKVTEWEL